MLERPRLCDVCDGPVDVMTITMRQSGGRTMPMKIGACQRCGKWFNESGIGELRFSEPDEPERRA